MTQENEPEELPIAAPLATHADLATLDATARAEAVVHLVRECAQCFRRAELNGDVAAAHDAAMAAIHNTAGLFSDASDPARHLFATMIAMFVDIRGGVTSDADSIGPKWNILLRKASIGKGLKRGYIHNQIGAFALAAVDITLKRNIFSNRTAANKAVAKMLADEGYSLKDGDPGQPRPISASAIYRWRKEHTKFPVMHAMVPHMLEIHNRNMATRRIESAKQALAYLHENGRELVKEWLQTRG